METVKQPVAKKRKTSNGESDVTLPEKNSEAAKKQECNVTDIALPHEINVLKFMESRASEIAMATKELQRNHPKLAMQQLPRHLRRRATSHNIKRLPRRLRERAAREFEMMKIKKTKRPSRRHRRRPANLLAEYVRRKRHHSWLETHIWFAKRFKMVELWGYKLALKPNDKGIRAAYRASARHCLLHDLSYYCCIELIGSQEALLKGLSQLTNQDAGLTFAAKLYLSGTREGSVLVFCANSYPYCAICPVTFLWKAVDMSEQNKMGTRQLWLWCHPSAHAQLMLELAKVFQIKVKASEGTEATTKESVDAVALKTPDERETTTGSVSNSKNETEAASLSNAEENEASFERIQVHVGCEVTMVLLKDTLVRFRLTGPLARACLGAALQVASVEVSGESGHWWKEYFRSEDARAAHKKQQEFWEQLKGSSCFPPSLVVALTVRDPRLTIPRIRTKALPNVNESFEELPFQRANPKESISYSAIWQPDVRDEVGQKKMPESQLNKMKYQNSLKEGGPLDLGEEESKIPVLLCHRPGVGTSDYGSGWDIVIPAGWSMPFWVSLVYRGGRAAGLQEHRAVAHEAGLPIFPFNYPDTQAGQQHSDQMYTELATKYRRYPPDKRPSFKKLGIQTPFFCPYRELVREWRERCVGVGDGKTDFFVLRHKRHLRVLQQASEECATRTNRKNVRTQPRCARVEPRPDGHLCQLQTLLHEQEDGRDLGNALVFVELQFRSKGRPKAFSAICMPEEDDLKMFKFGSSGPKENVHPVKRGPRQKGKKRKTDALELNKPSVSNVVESCQRRTVGFVEVGEFSFRNAFGTALGYCSVLGLAELFKTCAPFSSGVIVLVRAQNSYQYRYAKLRVVGQVL